MMRDALLRRGISLLLAAGLSWDCGTASGQPVRTGAGAAPVSAGSTGRLAPLRLNPLGLGGVPGVVSSPDPLIPRPPSASVSLNAEAAPVRPLQTVVRVESAPPGEAGRDATVPAEASARTALSGLREATEGLPRPGADGDDDMLRVFDGGKVRLSNAAAFPEAERAPSLRAVAPDPVSPIPGRPLVRALVEDMALQIATAAGFLASPSLLHGLSATSLAGLAPLWSLYALRTAAFQAMRLLVGFFSLQASLAPERVDAAVFRRPIISAQELARNRKQADLASLIQDHQVLLLGENHLDIGQIKAIMDDFQGLKRAGLTHIALEAGPKWHDRILLGAINLVFPARLQMWLLGRMHGIRFVGVDVSYGEDRDLAFRNRRMANGVETLLRKNPDAKMLLLVGASHLEDDDMPPEDWIQSLLRRRGISALPVLALDARKASWSVAASVAAAVRESGLAKERFYLPAPSSSLGFQGILNLPESAVLSLLPDPAAAAKRWARAIAALLRRAT